MPPRAPFANQPTNEPMNEHSTASVGNQAVDKVAPPVGTNQNSLLSSDGTGGNRDGAKNVATVDGTQRTNANDEPAMVGGLLTELRDDVERNRGNCTCDPSKRAKGGQHQKGCPKRHDAPSNLSTVVLPGKASAVAAPAGVVQQVVVATPADHSGYVDIIAGWFKKLRTNVHRIEKEKWAEVVTLPEAEQRAAIYKLEPERIERLAKIIQRTAKYYDLPELPPWVEALDFVVQDILFIMWQRHVDDKARKALAENKEQTEQLKAA